MSVGELLPSKLANQLAREYDLTGKKLGKQRGFMYRIHCSTVPRFFIAFTVNTLTAMVFILSTPFDEIDLMGQRGISLYQS